MFNTCAFRITAAAGTKLAGASSLILIIILISEKTLQPALKKPFWALIIYAVSLDQAFADCPNLGPAGSA